MDRAKLLRSLLRHIELFQEMGYLADYIESLIHDDHIELETISDLLECFETELFYIAQDSDKGETE